MPVDFGAFPKLKRLGVYWNVGFESLFDCDQLQNLFVFGPPDPDLTRFGGLRALQRLEFSDGRRLRSLDGAKQLGQLTFLGLYFQTGWFGTISRCDQRPLRNPPRHAVVACSNAGELVSSVAGNASRTPR